jgi:hypothetical protein
MTAAREKKCKRRNETKRSGAEFKRRNESKESGLPKGTAHEASSSSSSSSPSSSSSSSSGHEQAELEETTGPGERKPFFVKQQLEKAMGRLDKAIEKVEELAAEVNSELGQERGALAEKEQLQQDCKVRTKTGELMENLKAYVALEMMEWGATLQVEFPAEVKLQWRGNNDRATAVKEILDTAMAKVGLPKGVIKEDSEGGYVVTGRVQERP